MKQNDHLLGYCGLYCGNCLYYINTTKGICTDIGDGTYFDCHGCNSGNATPWYTDCGIKKCSREKGFRYCLQCSNFPCDMMTGFINDPKYPYHKDVADNMKRLEGTNLDQWSDEMDKKYTCNICGNKFTYFDGKCLRCSK